MRPSAGFLLRFFALAGVLFALWSFAGVGDLYSRAVIAIANPLIRLTSGFWVTQVSPKVGGGGLDVYIRHAGGVEGMPDGDVMVPFQPREQFSGLIPFLALLGASTTLPLRRWLRAAAIGIAAMFLFHLGLALLSPFMTGLPQAQLGVEWMRRINRGIDIVYAFYGIVGYAALPFLLWWVLVQRQRDSVPPPRPV